MLRCKTVSDALATTKYWKLPWYRRIGMRIHIALCAVCGRYNRQVVVMQDGVREYLRHEELDPPPTELCLSPAAREKIRRSLQG